MSNGFAFRFPSPSPPAIAFLSAEFSVNFTSFRCFFEMLFRRLLFKEAAFPPLLFFRAFPIEFSKFTTTTNSKSLVRGANLISALHSTTHAGSVRQSHLLHAIYKAKSGGKKTTTGFKDLLDSPLWKMAENTIEKEVATKGYDLLKTTGVFVLGMLATIFFIVERSARDVKKELKAEIGALELKMDEKMVKLDEKMVKRDEKNSAQLGKVIKAVECIMAHLKIELPTD